MTVATKHVYFVRDSPFKFFTARHISVLLAQEKRARLTNRFLFFARQVCWISYPMPSPSRSQSVQMISTPEVFASCCNVLAISLFLVDSTILASKSALGSQDLQDLLCIVYDFSEYYDKFEAVCGIDKLDWLAVQLTTGRRSPSRSSARTHSSSSCRPAARETFQGCQRCI